MPSVQQSEGENDEEILYCSVSARFLFFTVVTEVQSKGLKHSKEFFFVDLQRKIFLKYALF